MGARPRPETGAGRPAKNRGEDRARAAGRRFLGGLGRKEKGRRQRRLRRWPRFITRGRRFEILRYCAVDLPDFAFAMTQGGTIDATAKPPAEAITEYARAKVNLTLRVVGRRVDGYHDLESVVAFADCADHLTLIEGATLALETTGPTANACGDVADNLVLKAARLLAERIADLELGTFALEKMLPVAAGIGGGSADAAAALRLLARLNELSLDDARLAEVALLTGADVPVCLASRACDMTGVGEGLLPL